MTEKKVEWELYAIDHFKKTNVQIIKDKLREYANKDDDEEEDEQINALDEAETLYDTPFGIINKNDSLNPLNIIEHHRCCTNFNIDLPILALVNETPGVETLTVITRYQMIVGFGKLFESSKVKKEIEEKIKNVKGLPKEKVKSAIRTILSETHLGNND